MASITFISKDEFKELQARYPEYQLCIDWERNIYKYEGRAGDIVYVTDLGIDKRFMIPRAYVVKEEYGNKHLYLLSVTKEDTSYKCHWRPGILGPIRLPH